MEKKQILLPTDIENLIEKVYDERVLAAPNDAWDQRLVLSKKQMLEEMTNQETKGNALVVPLPTHARPWDCYQ